VYSLTGKSILVTGGTGSFGKAFVKRALEVPKPRRLVVFSRDELKQSEVMARFKHPRCASSSATCATRDRLRPAMHGIDVVVHAAALKQRGRRRVAAGRPRDPAGVPPCLRAARAWT